MVTNTHCGLVMLFRRFGEFFAAPYCGKGNFRVLRRVDKILNEKTGHMMKFKNPCIILDGVTCEIWPERVETGDKEVSQS
jgi:hypothetical protein